MEILLSHKSALEYWRICDARLALEGRAQQLQALPERLPPAVRIRQLRDLGLSRPLDVAVSKPGGRKWPVGVRPHLHSGQVPPGAVVDVGGGLMVSSPELCFFQMSRVLSLPNLLELGLELCGSYAVSVPNINYGSPETMLKRLFNRPCLSSVERLASFLSQTEGTFAQRRFSSVLRYLANNSASPMESKLFLLLTLPYKHGGYGLLKPKFNATVKPASTARRVSGKNTYRCDLYWPDYDLAVEYDSKQHHLAPREQTQDATKRNSLATLGVLLITVTSAHIYSPMETERVAMQLAQGMEKRLQYRNPGFAKAHHELRTALDLERFY